jgi:eukaryotic-like serine/threonine-protein kinase
MQQRETTDAANQAQLLDPGLGSFVSQLGQSCAVGASSPTVVDTASEDPADDLADLADSRIGTVVAERWRIDRLIGSGGMAIVYAATHRNGQRVALKFLRRELAGVPHIQERFLAEASIANRLNHPAATRVSDDGVADDGCLFLVMELLHGQTLEEYLQSPEGPLPLQRVAFILTTLLDVLDVAHKAGVVHRDIKPANVFLCEDGSVRLLDFGVARAMGVKSYSTMTGITVGTPAFMSPEQARARWSEVDGRSDLFAVAATGYLMLTGVQVRYAENNSEELLLAATEPVASLGELRPDLPACWVSLIDCALQFAKEERFDSAAAMRTALATCAAYSARPARAAIETADTLVLASSAAINFRRVDTTLPAMLMAPGSTNSRRSAKSSVVPWHTERVPDAPRRTNGRAWRIGLVAALCIGPLAVSIGMRTGAEPSIPSLASVKQPASVLPNENKAQPESAALAQALPAPVVPAAIPTTSATLTASTTCSECATGTVIPKQIAPPARTPLLRQRPAPVPLRPLKVVNADLPARQRLAAALSEQLSPNKASGEPPEALPPVPQRTRSIDPLERRK